MNTKNSQKLAHIVAASAASLAVSSVHAEDSPINGEAFISAAESGEIDNNGSLVFNGGSIELRDGNYVISNGSTQLTLKDGFVVDSSGNAFPVGDSFKQDINAIYASKQPVSEPVSDSGATTAFAGLNGRFSENRATAGLQLSGIYTPDGRMRFDAEAKHSHINDSDLEKNLTHGRLKTVIKGKDSSEYSITASGSNLLWTAHTPDLDSVENDETGRFAIHTSEHEGRESGTDTSGAVELRADLGIFDFGITGFGGSYESNFSQSTTVRVVDSNAEIPDFGSDIDARADAESTTLGFNVPMSLTLLGGRLELLAKAGYQNSQTDIIQSTHVDGEDERTVTGSDQSESSLGLGFSLDLRDYSAVLAATHARGESATSTEAVIGVSARLSYDTAFSGIASIVQQESDGSDGQTLGGGKFYFAFGGSNAFYTVKNLAFGDFRDDWSAVYSKESEDMFSENRWQEAVRRTDSNALLSLRIARDFDSERLKDYIAGELEGVVFVPMDFAAIGAKSSLGAGIERTGEKEWRGSAQAGLHTKDYSVELEGSAGGNEDFDVAVTVGVYF